MSDTDALINKILTKIKNNPFMSTIGTNISAVGGFIYCLFAIFLLIIEPIFTVNSAEYGGLIFSFLFTVPIYLIFLFLTFFIAFAELLKQHQIKNSFLLKNKIYLGIFYLGFIFNILFVFCFVCLLLPPVLSVIFK